MIFRVCGLLFGFVSFFSVCFFVLLSLFGVCFLFVTFLCLLFPICVSVSSVLSPSSPFSAVSGEQEQNRVYVHTLSQTHLEESVYIFLKIWLLFGFNTVKWSGSIFCSCIPGLRAVRDLGGLRWMCRGSNIAPCDKIFLWV